MESRDEVRTRKRKKNNEFSRLIRYWRPLPRLWISLGLRENTNAKLLGIHEFPSPMILEMMLWSAKYNPETDEFSKATVLKTAKDKSAYVKRRMKEISDFANSS